MKKFLVIIFIIFVLGSCKHQQKSLVETIDPNETKPLILVSKDTDAVFYKWLESSLGHNKFECFNMYSVKSNDSIRLLLKRADGVIISGGEDVYPGLYGKESDTTRCGEIDRRRDSLEQMMIKFAVYNRVPLLGICRGHQMLNVTMGGSLIIDIPEDVGSDNIHRVMSKTKKDKSTAVEHSVYIQKSSFLYSIVEVDSGKVYSNHHQAVDKLADGYIASSSAKDGVIESVETKEISGTSFILGLQWHPEAMDVKNPLSGKIAEKFYTKVKLHFLMD